jgi:hypothetical protein
MRRIGETVSGCVLVEMTDSEWRELEADLIDCSLDAEIEQWKMDFLRNLPHLRLSGRVNNALRRYVYGAFQGAKRGDMRNAIVQIFSQDGQMLSFHQWIHVAKQRRGLMMRYLRGIGTKTADEIEAAIDAYLKGK